MIGLGFTIHYARRASIEATSAAEAARAAKSTIVKVDAIQELATILEYTRQIRFRLKHLDWERISETCEDVQIVVAKLSSSENVSFSETSIDRMTKIAKIFKRVGSDADIAHHNNNKADLAKMTALLVEAATSIAIIQTELTDQVTQ